MVQQHPGWATAPFAEPHQVSAAIPLTAPVRLAQTPGQDGNIDPVALSTALAALGVQGELLSFSPTWLGGAGNVVATVARPCGIETVSLELGDDFSIEAAARLLVDVGAMLAEVAQEWAKACAGAFPVDAAALYATYVQAAAVDPVAGFVRLFAEARRALPGDAALPPLSRLPALAGDSVTSRIDAAWRDANRGPALPPLSLD
jgi:hypothetical protein